MFNLLLSAFLGVLASKLMDNNPKIRKKRTMLYIIAIGVLMLLAIIYNLIGKLTDPPSLYIWLQKVISGWNENIFLQCASLATVIILILIVNANEQEMLSLKKYSKKILEFTSHIKEGSVVTLIAGDMDFLGKVPVEGENILQLMENNDEYNQLYEFRDKIKLRILCNNKLDQNDLQAIKDNTTSPEIFYSKYRKGRNFNNINFQQLLRIGKIKSDFGNSVELRFYNSEDDDKRLRARFIDETGIVYRKESEKSKILVKEALKEVLKNHTSLATILNSYQKKEDLYSVNYLNNQEVTYYKDMFDLKWNTCNLDECNKTVEFCEALFHYVQDDEPKYRMALVYVNSYEIARKGAKRKEFPPFGVLYLAASVKKEKGWKVDIISVDENTKNDELKWTDYDVIGLSIVSSYAYGVLKRCYNASNKKKDVVTIVGGYQAEKFCNEVFRDFDADLIFKGEGEDNIRKFCRHYSDRNFADINGIIYRDNQDKLISTAGRGVVDIDKIPEPARELLNTSDVVMKDRLAGTEKTMVHVLFSRGCPYDCVYCAANQDGKNKRIRYRDKRNIVKELRNLKSTYDIEGFSIIDDCFLTNQDKAIEICEYIAESKLGLVWSLASRVDHINDEILKALKKAGCIEIKFGVETGSDDLLKSMQKNVTISMAEEAIRNTKKHGIGVKLFIITGLPGETDETHNETKKFLDKLKKANLVDRVSLLRYTPLAGSYIYDHPTQYGINNKMLNIENFEKVSLYRKSHDWWVDRNRINNCNKWYNDLRSFIDDRWSED